MKKVQEIIEEIIILERQYKDLSIEVNKNFRSYSKELLLEKIKKIESNKIKIEILKNLEVREVPYYV